MQKSARIFDCIATIGGEIGMQRTLFGNVPNISHASGTHMITSHRSFNENDQQHRVLIGNSLFQVPRYIITLHELLAHTPYDHVERKSLLNARQQLEDLSR